MGDPWVIQRLSEAGKRMAKAVWGLEGVDPSGTCTSMVSSFSLPNNSAPSWTYASKIIAVSARNPIGKQVFYFLLFGHLVAHPPIAGIVCFTSRAACWGDGVGLLGLLIKLHGTYFRVDLHRIAP